MGKLLANGCSHMQGSECDTNVAELFAEYLNLECLNIAHPGGGNHRILRSTIDYIEGLEHSSLYPDFILIGWTTHERFEISFDNNREDYTLDKQSENRDLQKFYRYADLHLADWEIGRKNTVLYMYLLQLYLNSKNINYMYVNMFNNIPKDHQSAIWNNIDQNKYCLHESSLIESAIDTFPNGWSDTLHAIDPKIHQWMYNKIITFYKEQYV